MSEKKDIPFSRYREYYQMTRSEHRPVPVLFPFLVIAALAAAAFVFLDAGVGQQYGQWPGWLANNAAHVTDVGRSWWVLTLTVTVLFAAWLARRLSSSDNVGAIAARAASMAFYILFSVGLASLIVNILKRAIGRPRPIEYQDHGLFSFNPFTWNFNFESFPSGHSTVNGALFMALAMLFPRFRWPLLAMGLCLALTRVFVGAHYPSDVTVGFGFGMWFAFMAALLFSRFGLLFDTADGKLQVRT